MSSVPIAYSPASATSDQWWKNAVTYCIDVESFLDLSGDGVGDIEGINQKIDYLASLGVSCLWLQPFYPSPNRDNGYDISDYYNVDPAYGSLGQFVELIRGASERGIRVIADLVVNHTSVEHPWFQAAGDRSSPFHDFYVWSDEEPPNSSDGIVFPGQQEGIWSYDKRAEQWYMHRFYKFQPDLNINNPAVRREVQRIIGFWLELGLSGFRVDAAPFMIEETGLDHPAVKDPHDYLRSLRAFLSRRRGDAILLAEANVAVDQLPLFVGDQFGDQMHMLFDFIGNQALYLSLVRGDARPLQRALRARPPLPPTCQWATFVRNHDELSLDKLSDKERQEVFAAFAPDEDMRIFGRGIRRRFPPMVDGDRAQMELAYALTFSLPGAPVLFYGEEIGMGDDQSLEGREAVRTAMQWIGDQGAGFSTAPRAAMRRPPVEGGRFGRRRVNVERESHQRQSFLNWMKKLINTRREWPEFGWGDWRLLQTGDDAVIAHTAEWQRGEVFAVHNLSKRQVKLDIELPKSPRRGRWHHILGSGKGSSGASQDDRLKIDIEPHGYRWLGRREGP